MNQQFMKEKKVFPLVIQMSLPMILSMAVNALYNIVDSYFVAKISGEAMTALSIIFPMQNMINAIAVGFGIGLNAVISFALGAGDERKADQVASTGILMSILHGVLLTVLCFLALPYFVRHFSANERIIQQGMEYAGWVLLFTVIIQIEVAYEKIFQSVGRMEVSMISMMTGFVVNIILDPIMIFGMGIIPEMGIQGAALATGIGQVSTLVVYLLFYFFKPISVKTTHKCIRFEKQMIKRVYGIGIPATLNMALPSVLLSALNTILIPFGDSYIMILGIYYKLQMFIYLSANGIIQGIRPLISYNYGAGLWKRIKGIIVTSEGLILGIMLAGTAVCQIYPFELIEIYSADAAVIQNGAAALRIISLGFAASSLSVVVSGVCEALGRGMLSLLLSFIRCIVVIIPVAWIFSQWWGANGIYAAFVLTEVTAAIVSGFILKKIRF